MTTLAIVCMAALGAALLLALTARLRDARVARHRRDELRRARNALAATTVRAERAEAELGRLTTDALERLAAEQVQRRRAEIELRAARARIAELEREAESRDGADGRFRRASEGERV